MTPFNLQIAAHLADLDAQQDKGQRNDTSNWIHGAARVAGACFDGSLEAQPQDPRLLARLARLCETPNGWLVCALTALTRPQFVIGLFENGGAEYLLGLPLITRMSTSHPSSDANAESDSDTDSGSNSDSNADNTNSASVCDLLRTLAADRPEPGKLERATLVLRDLAAHVPARQRVGILTLLAWAWWHTGMQSLAQRYIELAQEVVPTDPSIQLVVALNDSSPHWRFQAVREPR